MKVVGICVKCREKVFDKNNYVKFQHYSSGEKEHEEVWHKICFDETMKPKKLAYALAGRAFKVLNQAEQQLK